MTDLIHTDFGKRENPSINDDELSWLKGYNQAIKNCTRGIIKVKQ